MGFYEAKVLPRIVNLTCATKAMDKIRRPALEGLSGRVIELGFGSGPNLPLLPDEVTEVLAVDPAEEGRKLAAKRLAQSRVPVEFIGLDGQSLPLDDDSVDSALSTWTLCTIPDVGAALREVRRVLRPGGTFHFVEHGLSDDPRIARRQHRLTPIQRKVAGGCHLDRDIAQIIRDAGFELERCTTFQVAGPKTASFMYSGVAVPVD